MRWQKLSPHALRVRLHCGRDEQTSIRHGHTQRPSVSARDARQMNLGPDRMRCDASRQPFAPPPPPPPPSIHRWAVVSPPGDKRCSARRFVDKDALPCHKRPVQTPRRMDTGRGVVPQNGPGMTEMLGRRMPGQGKRGVIVNGPILRKRVERKDGASG